MPAVLVIATAFSSTLFLITDSIRRAFTRVGRERNGWLTMVMGFGSIAAAEVVHLVLMGHVESFPWVATTWFVAIVAAPFLVYLPHSAAE
jgi:hypothetical protein